jgi:hypothetical protein
MRTMPKALKFSFCRSRPALPLGKVRRGFLFVHLISVFKLTSFTVPIRLRIALFSDCHSQSNDCDAFKIDIRVCVGTENNVIRSAKA